MGKPLLVFLDCTPTLRFSEVASWCLRLGAILLPPRTGYLQLGEDDLERRDGEVIAHSEENTLSA